MELMINAKLHTIDNGLLRFNQVLNIGMYYYGLDGENVTAIKKSKVIHTECRTRKHINDSEAFEKK